MNNGLVPCGLNLQADVVTLRNGLSSILSLARQGSHINSEDNMSSAVNELKSLLSQIVEEVKTTIIDEEIALNFVPTKIKGGYNPKGGLTGLIEWEE